MCGCCNELDSKDLVKKLPSAVAPAAADSSESAQPCYEPTFSLVDLSKVQPLTGAKTTPAAVDDSCSDLSAAVLQLGGKEVSAWTTAMSALAPGRGGRLPQSDQIEALQAQVWRFRSCLNVRCTEHTARAAAVCRALDRQQQQQQQRRLTPPQSDAFGSWADFFPPPACSLASGPLHGAVVRPGQEPRHRVVHPRPRCEDDADPQLEVFALIAGVIESWSVAHLSRR
jgi:hypothetical protein